MGEAGSLQGWVYDNEDVEVAKFSTSPEGYASFWLRPEPGKTYIARVAEGVEIRKYNLPAARNTGVGLSVTRVGKDFNITINTTKDFRKPLHLIVHTRGVIQQILSIKPDNRENVQIPLKHLPAGISHITVLDASFHPQCERLIFKYPEDHGYLKLDLGKNQLFQKRKGGTGAEQERHRH